LALSRSRLYRFGGSSGGAGSDEEGDQRECGGQLDYLDLSVGTLDDTVTSGGEVIVSARGDWHSVIQGKEDVGYKEPDPAETPLADPAADQWPGGRSVAGFQAVTVGGGREYLVLGFGEREPPPPPRRTSGDGDDDGPAAAVAGQFWDDVWAYQIPAENMTAASLSDRVLSAIGRVSGEGKWIKLDMGPYDDEDDASAEGPGPRGWIGSAVMGDLEENGIVIWGGLNERNAKLGDGWILRLG